MNTRENHDNWVVQFPKIDFGITIRFGFIPINWSLRLNTCRFLVRLIIGSCFVDQLTLQIKLAAHVDHKEARPRKADVLWNTLAHTWKMDTAGWGQEKLGVRSDYSYITPRQLSSRVEELVTNYHVAAMPSTASKQHQLPRYHSNRIMLSQHVINYHTTR